MKGTDRRTWRYRIDPADQTRTEGRIFECPEVIPQTGEWHENRELAIAAGPIKRASTPAAPKLDKPKGGGVDADAGKAMSVAEQVAALEAQAAAERDVAAEAKAEVDAIDTELAGGAEPPKKRGRKPKQ